MSEIVQNPAQGIIVPSARLAVKIPPRPALLMALQHEMNKENYDINKVAALINRDVAMAGKLLESANSAYFNLSRHATTVRDAIAMIGMRHCSAIMSGYITKKTLCVGEMMMARFWDVSEKRAKGMSFLAEETRAVAPDLAYSFGLFCDIGIPLLKATFPGYVQTLSIANKTADNEFLHVEQGKHGIDHAIIGSILAEQWSIAPEVVEAIHMHHTHDVLYDESVSGTTRALVALNEIVEKAIEKFRGKGESVEWKESGAIARQALGLSMEEVDQLCESLLAMFHQGGAQPIVVRKTNFVPKR